MWCTDWEIPCRVCRSDVTPQINLKTPQMTPQIEARNSAAGLVDGDFAGVSGRIGEEPRRHPADTPQMTPQINLETPQIPQMVMYSLMLSLVTHM